MKHTLFASALVLALVGAGCAPTPGTETPSANGKPSPSRAAVAPREGFGKLPALQPSVAVNPSAAPMMAGTDVRASANVLTEAVSSAPGAAPMMGAVGTVSSAQVVPVTEMMKVRPPLPMPEPVQKQVTVEYLLETGLPTWSTDDDVLHVLPVKTDVGVLSGVAGSIGLPSSLTSQVQALTSFSVSWQDAQKFNWNLDATNRSVNAWKMYNAEDQKPQPQKPPAFDETSAKNAAKAFLLAHGFSSVASLEGQIQDAIHVLPMLKAEGAETRSTMPCVYGAADTPVAMPVSESAVSSMIYPSPCGWWPQQVTVEYPWMLDGRAMSDAYGNAQPRATVTVAIEGNEVQGTNVQLDETAERSRYTLIDAETAKRRLASGGRNPVYGWGTKNIKVHLKTAELVWMRYDSWTEGARDTYLVPGLRVTGTVDRGEKQDWVEEYRTVIPLVKDESFMPDTGYGSGGRAIAPMMVSGEAIRVTPPPGAPIPKK